MKFSILVAQFNNGRFFKNFYESIIKQSYNNWEVIIVDDCSTDNSIELMNQLIKSDHRFILYTNEFNRGCGYTKRRCVELANGEICGFVDPDDAITIDAVEVMIQTHLDHPEISLAHSCYYFCDENLKVTNVGKSSRSVTVTKYFTNLDVSVTAFTSFKKLFYDSTEGINPKLIRAVDQDLILKLSETGPFKFINQPLYFYRIHSGGISTNANGIKSFYMFLKVISDTEVRREVSLEDAVVPYLSGRETLIYTEQRLNDSLGFLLKNIIRLIRIRPIYYLKRSFKMFKLFSNSSNK
jgi:glycosyltransferase involved in cell wall biosynthesis